MAYLVVSNIVLLLILACLIYKYLRRRNIRNILRRLVDNANMGFYEYRAEDGVIVSANKGFVKILDLDVNPGDVTGRSLNELYIYLEDNVNIYERIRERGWISGLEYRFKTLKGCDKSVLLNAYMTLDPYGGGEVVAVLMEDVTEERAAYARMRESQERYEKLFKGSGDMVAIFSVSDLAIEEVNPVTEILTGYSQNEISGKAFDELIHPSFKEGFRSSRNDLLFTGSANLEAVLVRKDGEYRTVILTLSIIEVKEQKMALAIAKDISSLVREQEEEASRKKELENFWKAAVEREERIKELRDALEKAEQKLRLTGGKDDNKR